MQNDDQVAYVISLAAAGMIAEWRGGRVVDHFLISHFVFESESRTTFDNILWGHTKLSIIFIEHSRERDPITK